MTKPGESPATKKIPELQSNLDRVRAENNDLYNKIADLTEALKSKDYFEKPDYKFLVNENLNLRRKITELEQDVLEIKADNIKLTRQIDDQLIRLRKSGII